MKRIAALGTAVAILFTALTLSPVNAVGASLPLATSSLNEIPSKLTAGTGDEYLISWLGDAENSKCSLGDCALYGILARGKELTSDQFLIAAKVNRSSPYDIEYQASSESWVASYASKDFVAASRISRAGEVSAEIVLATGDFFDPKTSQLVEDSFRDVLGLDLIWHPGLELFVLAINAQLMDGSSVRGAYGVPELNSFLFSRLLEPTLQPVAGGLLTLNSARYSAGVQGFATAGGWQLFYTSPGTPTIEYLSTELAADGKVSEPKSLLAPIQQNIASLSPNQPIILPKAVGYDLIMQVRTKTETTEELALSFQKLELDGTLKPTGLPEPIVIDFANFESQVLNRSYEPFFRKIAALSAPTGELLLFGEFVDFEDGVGRVVSSSKLATWTFSESLGANQVQFGEEVTEASLPELLRVKDLLVGTFSTPTDSGSELHITFFEVSQEPNVPRFDLVDEETAPGQSATITGSELATIDSISNRSEGREWEYEIVEQTNESITVSIPADAPAGVDDELIASSEIGDFAVPGQISIKVPQEPQAGAPSSGADNPEPEAQWVQGPIAFWMKKISDTEVKFYAKNVLYRGKVQLYLNDQEVDWINATSAKDPKLRHARAMYYRVTGEFLRPGKNRFKVKLNGEWMLFENGKSYTTYTKK